MSEPATHTLSGLAPVSNLRRRDDATARIREALLTGKLLPGQRVKEVDLAAVLNVSRPTAREAMSELIHEGILVQVPYKGVRVAEITADEMLDVAEVRVALETVGAQRIAGQSDGRGVSALRAALEEHLTALDAGDQSRSDLTHLEFHHTIVDASENPVLKRIWPIVAAKVQLAMTMDFTLRHDPERDRALHEQLLRVIEAGDPQVIADEIRRHILDSAAETVARWES